MTGMQEERLIVLYSGDDTIARKKNCGGTILDQMFMSVESLRRNWSRKVEVAFVHTDPLSHQISERLGDLNVNTIRARRKVSERFPIANKILAGLAYRGKKDILFLDCDTVVHGQVTFDRSKPMLVAYDALQDVPEPIYRRLYLHLGVDFPSGIFSEKPSYEYYYRGRIDLFPLLNTGVFYIRNEYRDSFFPQLEVNFHKTYALLCDELDFYFDQICFALTMHQLGIAYEYFPPGYNFVCTSLAPHLRDWPRDKIVIEHYAGSEARPLVFRGSKIDAYRSGIVENKRLEVKA
jgi:hypothetical protein